jgi:hypothetical protein
MTLTGYKGSGLSPFLFNILGIGMDRFMPSGCSILQYADDAMVYSSHHVLQTACALVQPACSPLSVFFLLFGLTISGLVIGVLEFLVVVRIHLILLGPSNIVVLGDLGC